MDKGPFDSSLWTYLWVGIISVWGGIVSFVGKLNSGQARVFNITELIGEVVTSGFAGLLTYLMCEASGVSPYITAVLVGISGHMGSRALFLIELWAERKFKGE